MVHREAIVNLTYKQIVLICNYPFSSMDGIVSSSSHSGNAHVLDEFNDNFVRPHTVDSQVYSNFLPGYHEQCQVDTST